MEPRIGDILQGEDAMDEELSEFEEIEGEQLLDEEVRLIIQQQRQ